MRQVACYPLRSRQERSFSQQTMVGFNWHDRKGFDGASLLRTIPYLPTAHLPHIFPDIRAPISNMSDRRYESHPIVKDE